MIVVWVPFPDSFYIKRLVVYVLHTRAQKRINLI